MKLAVAAVLAIALSLLSLSLRHALLQPVQPTLARKPAARAASSKVEMRALASIDQRLHRKLRVLAQR